MKRCAFLLVLLIVNCLDQVFGTLRIVGLTVELQENPEGISTFYPRFSWQLCSDKNDIMQSAYMIEVATSKKGLRGATDLVWNTGYISSDQSSLVKYMGTPLESGKKYYWRVTVRTNSGEEAKSDIQNWSMALLNDVDWKAKWIGLNDSVNLKLNNKWTINPSDGESTILPARYLRKEFDLQSKPKRAVLYISGVGSSVCYMNGKRIGDDVFGPLPTWYDSSVSYLTYDVTSLLKKGANAIGVILGNGRFLAPRMGGKMISFGLPRLIVQLNVEYESGETIFVISDESWKATNKGPIIENNEYDGEKYDARLELGKWTINKYDDSEWMNVDLMEAPKGKLVAQLSPSMKVMEEMKPISIKSVEDRKYIIDMGQNMVGFMRVNLSGKKGQPIKMRFAEELKGNGKELDVRNLRSARAMDIYTPAFDGKFVWEPLFVYHGFRFVEITGLDYEPSVSDFIGKVVYDKMETTGSFETSEKLINQIYNNAYWGIRGSYRGFPSDCPQRDERLGWLGDRTIGAHGESFVFDNVLLYKKWLVDIEESMREDGSIADAAPRYWTMFNDNVTWPASFFYIPDMIYRQFGDDSSIKRHYPAMRRWINYMIDKRMRDYIMVHDNYGDWCCPAEDVKLVHPKDSSRNTNGQLLSTSVFYSILKLMEKFAQMNGALEDAKEYENLALKMKDAYNRRFFNEATAQYDNNTVTANLLSLRLGLVPESYKKKVFANIVEKTKTEFDEHLSCGSIGVQHLMRGLTEYGALELAYDIVTKDTHPSWGYMVKQGATTIWELWNYDSVGKFHSGNHVMLLGDLLIWFYENLAGIKNDSSSVGFKKIMMEPMFPERLAYVNASHVSSYGRIESFWKRKSNKLEWNILIPVNTTATVKLPLEFNVKVSNKQKGIHAVQEADGKLILQLGSGKYTFVSE